MVKSYLGLHLTLYNSVTSMVSYLVESFLGGIFDVPGSLVVCKIHVLCTLYHACIDTHWYTVLTLKNLCPF